MPLFDELAAHVDSVFRDSWSTRAGRQVPDPDDVRLGNDAVVLDPATVLYADLRGSTRLVDASSWSFAAEVYKAYLHCAAKLIRAEQGTITSYDGDRVMAVFIGQSQSTCAVRCAMKINQAVQMIINPLLKSRYSDAAFVVSQVVGIDTAPIHAARTGVRGGNDLVWVGRAANYAAKLTQLRLVENTWITKDTFDRLPAVATHHDATGIPMWKPYRWSEMADYPIYGSVYRWRL
jgi:class 3 adenylate cyclase